MEKMGGNLLKQEHYYSVSRTKTITLYKEPGLFDLNRLI